MALHAVIMAGGAGTRFWPESRRARPKQLLRLVGDRTMIQATVDRLGDLVPRDRVLILTSRQLIAQIAAQLPDVPTPSIVGEPCRRDTAPCLGLAAFQITRRDPDAVMLVMPSDHVIDNVATFHEAVRMAVSLVDDAAGRIVTFGIPPTYPSEAFGYVERGTELEARASRPTKSPRGDGNPAPRVFRVAQFREKPPAEIARQYLAAGRFYWNTGIFVWRARTILDAIKQHEPQLFARLETIDASFGKPEYPAVLDREFAAIRGISIDYAVMEHAQDVVVIEAPFAWDDVGSWQAIARLSGTDQQGNTIQARHLGLETQGSIIRGPEDHLIVTMGVKDCIVVHTPDATLVADKQNEESIRRLVQLIEERGWDQYL